MLTALALAQSRFGLQRISCLRVFARAQHSSPGVDKIVCIGKNYLEHAKELGDAVPEKPVIFNKPWSCAVACANDGDTVKVALPENRGVVHFETEIVLKIGPNQTISDATLGLDMTLRELQSQLKKNSHPWEIGDTGAEVCIGHHQGRGQGGDPAGPARAFPQCAGAHNPEADEDCL